MLHLGRRGAKRARITLGLAVGAIALAASSVPAHAAAPLIRGFTDDVWFTTNTPSYWVQKTQATGAKRVLLEVDWESVEPKKPTPTANPTDPNAAQFNFSYLDARVREFAGTGVEVGFLVTDAPRWAEANGGPQWLEAQGAWKPDPTAFGQVATALARRYSGTFPDPQNPLRALPRVQYYQAWAEPNLEIHLAPQWVSGSGGAVQTGPGIYRQLLNSFYAGIKSVNSSNVVLTGGVEGFGDPPNANNNQPTGSQTPPRMPPAQFLRGVLCLNSSLSAACHDQTHYDVLASDPYAVASPTTRATNRDDATAPDLGKLTKIQRAALNSGTLAPNARKQLWVTEFSYDSKPGNPYGLSASKQAQWLEQSMYVFWNEGVNTAIWYLVRDQLPNYDPNAYYSGVYRYNGTRKPSFTAYHFPFVVATSGRSARAWGISPSSGSVAVQRKKGRHWVTLFHVHDSAGGVFVHKVSKKLKGKFRAKIGSQVSLTWQR